MHKDARSNELKSGAAARCPLMRWVGSVSERADDMSLPGHTHDSPLPSVSLEGDLRQLRSVKALSDVTSAGPPRAVHRCESPGLHYLLTVHIDLPQRMSPLLCRYGCMGGRSQCCEGAKCLSGLPEKSIQFDMRTAASKTQLAWTDFHQWSKWEEQMIYLSSSNSKCINASPEKHLNKLLQCCNISDQRNHPLLKGTVHSKIPQTHMTFVLVWNTN